MGSSDRREVSRARAGRQKCGAVRRRGGDQLFRQGPAPPGHHPLHALAQIPSPAAGPPPHPRGHPRVARGQPSGEPPPQPQPPSLPVAVLGPSGTRVCALCPCLGSGAAPSAPSCWRRRRPRPLLHSSQTLPPRPSQAGHLLPYDSHRVGPFLGLVVCLSGLLASHKATLAAVIAAGGGLHSPALDKKCTHLVVDAPEGAKYKCAWQNPAAACSCVLRSWIQSVQRAHRVVA